MEHRPEVAGSDDGLALALVDAAPDGIVVVDEAGCILLVNRQTEVLFGYDHGELVGTSVDDLVPERLRPVHRADRTQYRAQPRTRPMGTNAPLSGLRKDGTEFPVEISLSPLADGSGLRVVAVVRDVTDRVAAEDQARAVREIVDATRDGLLIFDAGTLRFTYVNQGAVDQVGYPRDEMLQMTMLDIAPEFTRERLLALLAPMERGELSSTTFTTVHRRRDGKELPVEVLLQAISGSDGRPRSYVKIARDIRERLESDERLRHAEHELGLLEDRERIARDLHDLVIQRLFAAGMSLQGAQARSTQTEVSERIETVVNDLDDTIRELRSVIFALQPRTHGPGVRSQILRIVAEEGHALGFEPHVRFDGPLETIAEGTASELLATLREALSNVARHAAAGSVEIVVHAGDEIRLRVVDDGRGLSDHRSEGNGIRNMKARAARLGGHCHIGAGPDGGTVVEWQIPSS